MVVSFWVASIIVRVFWCATARMSELELESQFAKTFRRGKMTFWAMPSQVIKHGSTNTTLKWSGKVHNGRLPILHDQKIPSVQIKSQNNVADFFLILEGLFIMNLYQLDKQSTKFTIWKYWKGCGKKLDRNYLNFLPTTHGSCITTMHLLTRHCLWGVFNY